MNDLGEYYERHRRHIGAAWQPACTDAVASTKWIGGEPDPTLRHGPSKCAGYPAIADMVRTWSMFRSVPECSAAKNVVIDWTEGYIRSSTPSIIGMHLPPI